MVLDFKRKMMFADNPAGGSGSYEIPAPDSVLIETEVLQDTVMTITAEEAEEAGYPEAEGRVLTELDGDFITNNLINDVSDLGGKIRRMTNCPISGEGWFRTEFRPKQGLHNLDFTTPAETPSDDTPSDAAQ